LAQWPAASNYRNQLKLLVNREATMSTKKKANQQTVKTKRSNSRIVWFEIPADDPERAKKFYGELFGWKIQPFSGVSDYWHIDTGGGDESLDGGMMLRKHPAQRITDYVAVASVDDAATKVQTISGQICKFKTAVPQMGYFVICQDTEGNEFALWEMNERAK
jgi:predicted enzyme related to lactoylglutathione lyase